MSGSILVIDDDEDDYTLIKDSFLEIGFSSPVYFAQSGAEGLRLLNELRPNIPILIILDLYMPAMNGMEVLKSIHDEFGIAVILYTALCTEEIIKKAKSAGALDCIKKGTSYADNLRFAKHIVQLLPDLTSYPST